jgi:hypothetical protein
MGHGSAPSGAGLDRAYTGAASPSLVVKNEFPVAQHVFVDWVHRGELLPHSSRTFELTAGTHTVTCADSRDPDRNPLAITETFEAGFSYTYVVVPQ